MEDFFFIEEARFNNHILAISNGDTWLEKAASSCIFSLPLHLATLASTAYNPSSHSLVYMSRQWEGRDCLHVSICLAIGNGGLPVSPLQAATPFVEIDSLCKLFKKGS